MTGFPALTDRIIGEREYAGSLGFAEINVNEAAQLMRAISYNKTAKMAYCV